MLKKSFIMESPEQNSDSDSISCEDIYEDLSFVSTDAQVSSSSESEGANRVRTQKIIVTDPEENTYQMESSTEQRKIDVANDLDGQLSSENPSKTQTVNMSSKTRSDNCHDDFCFEESGDYTDQLGSGDQDVISSYARKYSFRSFYPGTEQINTCPFKASIDSTSHKYSDAHSSILSQTMFPASGITTNKMLMMVQSMRLRHHLDSETIKDMIEFTKILAGPEFGSQNLSQHFFTKFSLPHEDFQLFTFYCPKCICTVKEFVTRKELNRIAKIEKESRKVKCKRCLEEYIISTSNRFHFINHDIKFALQSLMQDQDLLDKLIKNSEYARQQKDVRSGKIRDYYDSDLYKNNPYIHDKKFEDCLILTAMKNIDGGKIKEKSPNSYWPIQLIINEMPIELRSKINILAASWYTKSEPDCKLMQLYLEMFLKSLEHLFTQGFDVMFNNKPKRVLFLPLFVCVDAKARAPIAYRQNVSGYLSCQWCYHKGTYSNGAVRFPLRHLSGPRLYSRKKNPSVIQRQKIRSEWLYPERTHGSNLQDAIEAINLQTSIRDPNIHCNGVKGLSVLAKIPGFDTVWSFPEEYLHSACLGIAKQLNKTFMASKAQYSLKKRGRFAISEKLLKIKPLTEMYRTPTSLDSLSQWKAADWLYWLLYYAVICYYNILHSENFTCLVLACKIMYTLLNEEITENDLESTDESIFHFLRKWQGAHGDKSMSSNMHSIIHLTRSIRKSGPLSGTSAFGPESNLSRYKNSVHSPKGVAGRISHAFFELYEHRNKLSALEKNEQAKPYAEFCKKLTYNIRDESENHLEFQDGATLYYEPSNDIQFNVFQRCRYNGAILHSKTYNEATTVDNSFFQLTDGRIGQIQHFYEAHDHVYVKIQEFKVKAFEFDELKLDHLLQVTETPATFDVPITKVEKKLIHIDLGPGEEWVVIPRRLRDVK